MECCCWLCVFVVVVFVVFLFDFLVNILSVDIRDIALSSSPMRIDLTSPALQDKQLDYTP